MLKQSRVLMIAIISLCVYTVHAADAGAEQTLNTELMLTADILGNVRGGGDRSMHALGNVYVGIGAETSRLGWWANGAWHFSAIATLSRREEDLGGELQSADSLSSPSTIKVFEILYEHRFFSDRLDLRFGFCDYNRDFNVLQSASYFVNSTFALQPEIDALGVSTYPDTALSAQLRYVDPSGIYAQVFLADGVPGDPNRSLGNHISIRASDGLFLGLETGFSQAMASVAPADERATPYFKLALGGWYHTREITDFADRARDENAGLYVIGEASLTRQIRGFLRFGANLSDRNEIARLFGGGVNIKGLIPRRERDILAIGVSHARNGSSLLRRQAELSHAETVVELTYVALLGAHLTLQPDLQFIIDPGQNSRVSDLIVAGARLQWSF